MDRLKGRQKAEDTGTNAGFTAGATKGNYNRKKDRVHGEQALTKVGWNRRNIA